VFGIQVTRHGGPEVLEWVELDDPEPGPRDLIVDLAAAGLNFLDVYQRSGLYPMTLPFTPGSEGAGVVRAVGSEVTRFSVGDRVAWSSVLGSYGQQVRVPEAAAVAVPEGLGLDVVAAVMLQGMTAHYLCTSSYPVDEGDPVVVHAAAGGVGLLLTQMVKMRGGVVIGTASTADKAALARQAGADHVAGYEDFGIVVREVTGGAGAAAVYDGVGRTTFDTSLAALRPRGFLVLYGSASGPVPPFDLGRLASGGSLSITRPTLAHFVASREELLRRAGDLFRWIGEGRLEVRIGGTYPLDEAARAHDDLGSRRTTGKLILLPWARQTPGYGSSGRSLYPGARS
jgi:NADPH:quinone reductase